MEAPMNINSTLVRKLREAKAWSQDHLARVCGVSLRTIQRVEADGSAGAETKMAIASAFGISVEELASKPGKPTFPGLLPGTACGVVGVVIGAACACAGVAAGPNTASEAGVSYGLIGLMSGLSLAAIGMTSNRYRHVHRAEK